MKCFLSDRLGAIHPEVGHVVFQTDPEYPELYPEREVAHIQSLLKMLFKVLHALVDSTKEYSDILKVDIKAFTRKHKNSDLSVEEYSQILEENKRRSNEIDELFFEDSLLMGPIVARVGDLKKRLKKKLGELNKVLLEQIKKKVVAAKEKIGEEVDNVLAIIRKQSYKNIEEVVKTK